MLSFTVEVINIFNEVFNNNQLILLLISKMRIKQNLIFKEILEFLPFNIIIL